MFLVVKGKKKYSLIIKKPVNTFYTLMLKALTVLLLSILAIFASLLIIAIFVLLISLGGR